MKVRNKGYGFHCSNSQNDIKVYAHWQKNQFSVNFDANSGSGTPDKTEDYMFYSFGRTALTPTLMAEKDNDYKVAPTCKQTGYVEFYCASNNDRYRETIPATGTPL